MTSDRYTLRSLIASDLRRSQRLDERIGRLAFCKRFISALVFSHGFSCVFWYRINRKIALAFPRIARLLGVWRYYRYANDISYCADIGPGFVVSHTSDIVIGAHVKAGRNLLVYNGVTIGGRDFDRLFEQPTLGDDVIIGTGAKVLGNIDIGDGSVIGAMAVCLHSVPAGAVAVGNPARTSARRGSYGAV